MREIALAVGLVVVLVLVGLVTWVEWRTLMVGGAWLVLVGFVVGIPPAFVYHVMLRAALKRRDQLPRGWYWRPIELNARLEDDERRRVLPWMYVGGLGFVVIVLGLVLLGSGMLLAIRAV